MQEALFQPMFALLGLTLLVWIYLFAKRIPYIQQSGRAPDQVDAEMMAAAPAEVRNPSDNFKNLFEVPVLFYVFVLYANAAEIVDQTTLVAAWAYVALRATHSAVHCTINLVLLRFWLYFASCAVLVFLWVRAAWL